MLFTPPSIPRQRLYVNTDIMHWQGRYAPCYGFWRAYVTDVIYRYLECGDLHFGFARVRCQQIFVTALLELNS